MVRAGSTSFVDVRQVFGAAHVVVGPRGTSIEILEAVPAQTDGIRPLADLLTADEDIVVLAGRVQNLPVIGDTAQREGPVRSTVGHNPATGTGHDGSDVLVASAGQGERPAQPRHRPHTRGRRRTRRTSHTPTIHKPSGL